MYIRKIKREFEESNVKMYYVKIKVLDIEQINKYLN